MKTFNNVFDNIRNTVKANNLQKGDSLKNHLYDGLDVKPGFLKAYGKQLDDYADNIQKAGDKAKISEINIDGFNKSLTKSGQEAVKSTTFMQDVGNGLKSIGKTALSMVGNSVLDMAIGTGFQFVISEISDFIHREEIAIEKGQKAQSTISDTFNTFSSGKSTISNLGKSFSSSTDQINTTSDAINSVAQRYTELSKGVDSKTNKNVSLSSEDYQNYLDLSNQLAQLYPRLQSSTDSQGNAILDLGNDAKSAARSIQELYNAQMLSSNVKIGAELQDALKGTSTQIKQYNEEIDKYDKQSKKAEESAKSFASVQNQFKLPEADDDYKTYFEVDSDKFDSLESYYNYTNAIRESIKKSGIKNAITDEAFDQYNKDTEQWFQRFTADLQYASEDQLKTFYNNMQAANNELAEKSSLSKSEADKQLNSTKLLLQDSWKGMTDSLGQYLQTKDSFDKLDFGLQKALLDNLNNIDIKPLTEKYNGDALLFMYDQFIDPLSKMSSESQKAISDLFNVNEAELTVSEYADTVNKAFEEAFPNDTETQDKWKKAFGYSDILKENQDQLDKLKANDAVKDYADQIDSLSNEDLEIAIDVIFNDGWKGNFDQLKQKIQDVKDATANETMLSAVQKHVTDTQATLAAVSSAITESASDTGASAESITAVGQAFSEFENLNPALLFKSTAKGVKANTKAMAGLVDLQHKMKAQDFSDAIKNQTKAIAEQNEVVKQASEENKGLEQDRLKSMFGDLYSLQQARSQFNALYQQQRKLFSDYGEWVNASSTENAGDPYVNMVSGLKEAKEAYDKGLVGTDDFKSFAKMISPTGSTDAENFAENYSKAARYLTEDISGVKNFLNDLESEGLAEYNAELDKWHVNIDNMADAAKKMGMGKDFMTNMFGRLDDYGFANNFITDTEDGVLKLSDAYTNLAESQAKLEQLKKEDPGNTTAIEAAEKEVKGYQNDVKELGTHLSEIASDSADAYNQEIDSAKSQIAFLGKEYENVLKNNLYGDNQNAILQHLKSTADGLASLYGVESFDVTGAENNAKAYYEALQSATIEKPAEIDFGDDTEKAENYASAVGKIQDANKNNNQTLSQATETLKQFNSEQVKGINLFDGAYDSDELKPAEQALDQLGTELGLTAEEMALLPQVLEAMGVIKPKTDNSDVDETNEKLDKTKESVGNLQNMEGSSFDLNVDVTGEENVEQAKEIVSTMPPNTSANVHVEVDGEEDTERTIDLIESAPKNQNSVLTVTVAGDDPEEIERIMTAADEANANGANVVVKVEGQLGDINTSTAEVTDKEVELLGKVSHIDTTGDYQPVALKGNVVQIDTTGSYQSVALKGNIVQLEGTPSDPVNVVGNITEVTGGEGKTIEVIGHIATVTGGNGKMINVIGNITSTVGGGNKDGNVTYGVDSSQVDNYHPSDKNAQVRFSKDSSIPDGYQPSDKSANVVYGVDSSAVAAYQPSNKSAIVTYTIQTIGGPSKGGGVATGTMTSVAHADGTAYNVLNSRPLSPAHANGQVALEKDEKALVNEIGMNMPLYLLI